MNKNLEILFFKINVTILVNYKVNIKLYIFVLNTFKRDFSFYNSSSSECWGC